MDKEKWINETLESINGIKKAEPNPFLFSKILSRIKSGDKTTAFIPVRKIAFGLASMVLLAFINIAVLFYPTSSQQTIESGNTSASSFIPSQSNPYLEILIK